MSTKSVTIDLNATTYEWLEELARISATSVSEVVASILREEQARAALEGVAAWARGDEGAPTLDEVERARARILRDEEEP